MKDYQNAQYYGQVRACVVLMGHARTLQLAVVVGVVVVMVVLVVVVVMVLLLLLLLFLVFVLFCFVLFCLSSGGWVKRKLKLPHFHVSAVFLCSCGWRCW